MSSGRTSRSKSAPLTPLASAASRKVVPSLCAFLAIAAELAERDGLKPGM